MVDNSSFISEYMIRWYYAYKDIWEATIREDLHVKEK